MRKNELNKYLGKRVIVYMRDGGIHAGILGKGLEPHANRTDENSTWYHLKGTLLSFRSSYVKKVDII